MQAWSNDKNLRGVRGTGRPRLPEVERQPRRTFWADAEGLARRAAVAAGR